MNADWKPELKPGWLLGGLISLEKMSSKVQELKGLIATAQVKGNEYFSLLERSEFDFDKVEAARKAAVQALREVQQFADLHKLSGAGLVSLSQPDDASSSFAGIAKLDVELEMDKLKKNVEIAQKALKS